MAKYAKKASKEVEKAMHERKRGQLKSGGSGKTVKSRKQAIAIGLEKARKAGAKVPPRKVGAKKGAAKKRARKSAANKGAVKTSSARKSSSKTGGRKSSAKQGARKTSR